MIFSVIRIKNVTLLDLIINLKFIMANQIGSSGRTKVIEAFVLYSPV